MMTTLNELKSQIDQGAQAQLVLLHPVNMPYQHGTITIHTGVRILISHCPAGYQWRLDYMTEAPETGYTYATKHDWNFGPDWNVLIERIEGIQTTSDQWELLEPPAQ